MPVIDMSTNLAVEAGRRADHLKAPSGLCARRWVCRNSLRSAVPRRGAVEAPRLAQMPCALAGESSSIRTTRALPVRRSISTATDGCRSDTKSTFHRPRSSAPVTSLRYASADRSTHSTRPRRNCPIAECTSGTAAESRMAATAVEISVQRVVDAKLSDRGRSGGSVGKQGCWRPSLARTAESVASAPMGESVSRPMSGAAWRWQPTSAMKNSHGRNFMSAES
jgi:hypothetical protein